MAQRSMALLDEIRAAQAQTRIGTCTVGMILGQVEDPDRQALEDALSDPAIYGTTIAKVLKTRGFEVGSQAIQRHRRKACNCG